MIATPTHVPLSLIKSPSMKRASCFAGGAFLTLFLTVACRQAPNSTDQTSTLDAGLIDEVLIYDRVLTAAEILELAMATSML